MALSGDPDDALQYLGPLANGAAAIPKIREDYATVLLAAGRSSDARQVLAIDVPPQQLDEAMATLASLPHTLGRARSGISGTGASSGNNSNPNADQRSTSSPAIQPQRQPSVG